MSDFIHRIAVNVASTNSANGYEVVVGAGLRNSFTSLIDRSCAAYRYAIITDDRVAELYGTRVMRALVGAGHRVSIFAFPAGEEQKTRETWALLSDAMVEAGIGRDGAVIALGGGVAGDIAGFVAATYMRGLPVVQIPTSLLAMIDACIGGKTGVDTPAGKNLIGAFHPPRLVAIDPELVRTLPVEHLRSGLAEAVKHGAIADAEYANWIEDSAEALLAAEPEALARLIVRSIEIKADYVRQDEHELGPRKALNFGHTIGHAVEVASGYRLLHGESIAIGMVIEATLGEHIGITERGTATRLRQLLSRLGLPTSTPVEVPLDAILDATVLDKKARNGKAEYALIERLGSFANTADRWSVPVADEVVREVLGRGE